MKAVILVAGVASRLRPLTNNTPKCLLQIGRKTILQRTIDNLISNGIEEFIIVTGYLQEMIKSYMTRVYPGLSVQFKYNEVYDSTNNVYSLWLARDLIGDNSIILMDGDIVFDKQVIRLLLQSEQSNGLALRPDDSMGEEEMKVRIADDKRILEISKTIAPALAAGESMGIARFDKSFVRILMEIVCRRIEKDNLRNDFYEAAFQEAISNGSTLYAVNIGDFRCVEIDTVEDIEYTIKEVVRYLDE